MLLIVQIILALLGAWSLVSHVALGTWQRKMTQPHIAAAPTLISAVLAFGFLALTLI
jgi:hypothetical protein